LNGDDPIPHEGAAMPIVRVDVPQGYPRQALIELKQRMEDAIARTWATDHIYVAIREFISAPGDRSAIMTLDLRSGRGAERERSAALYRLALDALKDSLGVDPHRFVLLVRQYPEAAFVVDGGIALPPLAQITPAIA
jgi:hypothetical protein